MTLFTANGQRIEPRAKLPTSDVALDNGRTLGYRGSFAVIPGSGVWQGADGLRVIGSVDPTPHGHLLHISISYGDKDKDPSWEDIKQCRYAFFGKEIDCMMMLPKEADYVNVHEHTFHVWQTPVEWGVL